MSVCESSPSSSSSSEKVMSKSSSLIVGVGIGIVGVEELEREREGGFREVFFDFEDFGIRSFEVCGLWVFVRRRFLDGGGISSLDAVFLLFLEGILI